MLYAEVFISTKYCTTIVTVESDSIVSRPSHVGSYISKHSYLNISLAASTLSIEFFLRRALWMSDTESDLRNCLTSFWAARLTMDLSKCSRFSLNFLSWLRSAFVRNISSSKLINVVSASVFFREVLVFFLSTSGADEVLLKFRFKSLESLFRIVGVWFLVVLLRGFWWDSTEFWTPVIDFPEIQIHYD